MLIVRPGVSQPPQGLQLDDDALHPVVLLGKRQAIYPANSKIQLHLREPVRDALRNGQGRPDLFDRPLEPALENEVVGAVITRDHAAELIVYEVSERAWGHVMSSKRRR